MNYKITLKRLNRYLNKSLSPKVIEKDQSLPVTQEMADMVKKSAVMVDAAGNTVCVFDIEPLEDEAVEVKEQVKTRTRAKVLSKETDE